jgi:hypothetical protein
MKYLMCCLLLGGLVGGLGGCAQTNAGPGGSAEAAPADDEGCIYVYELPDMQAQKAGPMVLRRVRVCGAAAAAIAAGKAPQTQPSAQK